MEEMTGRMPIHKKGSSRFSFFARLALGAGILQVCPGGLLLCLLLCWQPLRAEPPVVVDYVLDGDTVILASGETLRLASVDAPELAHDGRPAQYHAREARAGLRDMLRSGPLQVVMAPDGHDHYGRLLGTLQLADGRLANVELLRRGLGFYYPHPKNGLWLHKELLAAQREAMEQGRGLWPGLREHLRTEGPVVGNQASLRFFSQGCRDARRISRRNRVHFASPLQAFRQGYAPARHCGVWPAAP